MKVDIYAHLTSYSCTQSHILIKIKYAFNFIIKVCIEDNVFVDSRGIYNPMLILMDNYKLKIFQVLSSCQLGLSMTSSWLQVSTVNEGFSALLGQPTVRELLADLLRLHSQF
jgi:hypothetical protein